MAAWTPDLGPSVPKFPTVNVYVGPQKAHYVVSRELLYSNSPTFKKHLSEHPEPDVKAYLASDEPETFELLVKLMRFGTLSLDTAEGRIFSKPDDFKALGDGCHLFCNLYCLCFRIGFSRDRVGLMEKISKWLPPGQRLPLQPRTVRKVLEGLPGRCELVEYILQAVVSDLAVNSGNDYDYYAELLEGPNAIQGLVRALFMRMKEPRPDQIRAYQPMLPADVIESAMMDSSLKDG